MMTSLLLGPWLGVVEVLVRLNELLGLVVRNVIDVVLHARNASMIVIGVNWK